MSQPQPRAKELCDLVAALVNAEMVPLLDAPLSTQFQAQYNPAPYYEVKDLNTLKVDVCPTGLKRPRYIRKARAFEWRIDVVVQKRCVDTVSQTQLIDLADDLLGVLLDVRLRDTQDVLIQDGEFFDDELYDTPMRVQGHVFWTGARLQVMWWP